MRRLSRMALGVLVIFCGPDCGELAAQELEPRLFSNAPVGTNYLALVYGYSSGNVLLDPATPIEGLKARLQVAGLGYARVLDVFGKSGQVDVVVPFAGGDWEGMFDGIDSTRNATGVGDPALRFSIRFLGAPALKPADFSEYQQGTIVGGAVQIRVPVGQYDPERLINLGGNRWVFRPQLGMSHRAGNVIVESIVSGWFFTRNDEFWSGNELTQKPLGAIQAHGAYVFSPGLWLAGNIAYWGGGRTAINDDPRDNLQSSWRLGGTLAIPISGPHMLKLAAFKGVAQGAGADFDSFLIAYQFRWTAGPPNQQ